MSWLSLHFLKLNLHQRSCVCWIRGGIQRERERTKLHLPDIWLKWFHPISEEIFIYRNYLANRCLNEKAFLIFYNSFLLCNLKQKCVVTWSKVHPVIFKCAKYIIKWNHLLWSSPFLQWFCWWKPGKNILMF